MDVLGLDTSNYTTSAAVFNGRTGENIGRLLDVRPGELGLRQSDALFQHVKHLPELLEQLAERERLIEIKPLRAPGRWRAPICPVFWRGSLRDGDWLLALVSLSIPIPINRGIWPRPPGLLVGWSCWTPLFWLGTCREERQSCS